jgi:hypothetical protein
MLAGERDNICSLFVALTFCPISIPIPLNLALLADRRQLGSQAGRLAFSTLRRGESAELLVDWGPGVVSGAEAAHSSRDRKQAIRSHSGE